MTNVINIKKIGYVLVFCHIQYDYQTGEWTSVSLNKVNLFAVYVKVLVIHEMRSMEITEVTY